MRGNKNGPLNGEDETRLRSEGTIGAEPTAPTADARVFRELEIGTVLVGRYVISEIIGRGGMGCVYKAHDKTADIDVALKFIPGELSVNTLEMEEVKRNFKLVQKLNHPNIAAYKQLEQDATGEYFLVMEYVEGKNLDGYRRSFPERKMPLKDAVRIVAEVAKGLDFAHSNQIIHRDIKPSNIIVTADGTVKITDFGLASEIRSSLSRVSGEPFTAVGTRPYMAPEQWTSKRLDGRTDVWALGVTFYELTTGRLAFYNEDVEIFRNQVLHDTPKMPEVLNHNHRAALRKALAKGLEDRFRTAGEFIRALGAGRVRRKLTGKKLVIAGGIVLLVAVIAVNSKRMNRLLTASKRTAEESAKGRSRSALIVPDEYETIQEAIDAALPGDTVKVKQGVYTEVISFKDGIQLIGDGADLVTIRCDPSEGSVIEVRGCASGLISGVTLENVGSEGDDDRYSLLSLFDSSVEVFRCTIQNSVAHGIAVRGKSSPAIRECELQSNLRVGICVIGHEAKPTLKDNICRANEQGGIAFAKGAGGVAKGNTCENNRGPGILVLDEGTAPTLEGNFCRANDMDGIGFGNGASGVAEGNTCENNKRAGITVLDEETAPTLRKNLCRDNRIDGIHFGGGAGGAAEENTCEKNSQAGISVYGKGSDPTLSKNLCRDNGTDGIQFSGQGASAMCQGNTCENNKRDGILVLDKRTAPMLKGNVCRGNRNGLYFGMGALGVGDGNTCEKNQACGILVFGNGSAPQLRKNFCWTNGSHGIGFANGASGVAEKNSCENNKQYGILVLDKGTVATLKDNSCSANGNGIGFSAGSGRAEGNTCERNNDFGVVVSGKTSSPTLKKNLCSYNGASGIVFAEGSGGTVEGNICSNNGHSGIYVRHKGTAPTLRKNRCDKNVEWGIWHDGEARPLIASDNLASGNGVAQIKR